jgi:hypothetical protein
MPRARRSVAGNCSVGYANGCANGCAFRMVVGSDEAVGGAIRKRHC